LPKIGSFGQKVNKNNQFLNFRNKNFAVNSEKKLSIENRNHGQIFQNVRKFYSCSKFLEMFDFFRNVGSF